MTQPASHQAAYDYFNSRYGTAGHPGEQCGDCGRPVSGTGPEHHAGDVPMALLRKVFETNFFAQVALTEALLPLIRKSPAGRIVNLSSILGSLTLHADPKSPIYHAKSFAYDASKTALNAFTVHLAYELRDTKIKVNSAHPGWVKTDMGGPEAPMELSEGGKTSAALATLPDDGPTGGYFHLGNRCRGENAGKQGTVTPFLCNAPCLSRFQIGHLAFTLCLPVRAVHDTLKAGAQSSAS